METQKENVLRFVKKVKILRQKDLKKINAPLYYLSLLEKEGLIQKLSRGLYATNDYAFDEQQTYLEACARAPNATLCLLSALSFYQFTTQNPHQVWIAIGNKSWQPKLEYPPLKTFRFSGKALTEGIQNFEKNGIKIKVYCPAKTIADCFKYRNKIGHDVAIEALKEGLKKKLFSLKELNHYAKICRVQNIVRPYIEALL